MKKILLTTLVIACLYWVTLWHGWRTDTNWWHNCRTWSCAGTYHFHNGSSTNNYKPIWYEPPKPVVCNSYQCKLNGVCYNKPANSSCSNNGIDAWVCNSWYKESWSSCTKIIVEKEIEVQAQWFLDTNKKVDPPIDLAPTQDSINPPKPYSPPVQPIKQAVITQSSDVWNWRMVFLLILSTIWAIRQDHRKSKKAMREKRLENL